jgi:hypothetical protein
MYSEKQISNLALFHELELVMERTSGAWERRWFGSVAGI